MSESQLMMLSKMEQFGWVLAFIRMPLFQDIVPVLFHPDSMKYGTLNNDGTMDTEPTTGFRLKSLEKPS